MNVGRFLVLNVARLQVIFFSKNLYEHYELLEILVIVKAVTFI